ncbi:MAG: type III secretion inner membrane ring lipoprotein SctJ [Parachlamydiaceae bacterium]
MQAKLRHSLLTVFHYLLIASFCLPLLTGCESRKIIVNSLDERDANEILVFLSGKNIDAIKVQSAPSGAAGGGSKVILWDISVNANQGLDAMAYLNQAGLPRRRSYNLLDIFTGAGLVPSEMEQKIRYQTGLAEQIASTIRKIDGVLDAEVQISFPEEDPLNPTEKKQKITASVWIKHNGVLDDPNSHLSTKIKRLVAASVPGLDYDNVTVVGERARFSELSFGTQPSSTEDKAYVSIWGLIISKESVTSFRIVFFSFTILIFLMLVFLIWLGWKMYPIFKEHGGIKELFHLKPMSTEKKQTSALDAEKAAPKKEGEKDAKKEVEKDPKKAAVKPGEAGKSLVDKDVDQT